LSLIAGREAVAVFPFDVANTQGNTKAAASAAALQSAAREFTKPG
jgi:hypothetical protein